MRVRDKSLELAGEFSSTVPSNEYMRSARGYKNFNLWENPLYEGEPPLKNSLKERKWTGGAARDEDGRGRNEEEGDELVIAKRGEGEEGGKE